MCSYLQQCSMGEHGQTDGTCMTAEGVAALHYLWDESWWSCVEAVWEALRGLQTWDLQPLCEPFSEHCSASHAWRLLLATQTHAENMKFVLLLVITSHRGTHSLSLSTHVNSTCTQYTHCFNQLFHWSHSDSFIYYATSHKPMISEKALTIILFQSSVWTDLFVFLHVAIENKNRTVIKLQIVFSPGSVVPLICCWKRNTCETVACRSHMVSWVEWPTCWFPQLQSGQSGIKHLRYKRQQATYK